MTEGIEVMKTVARAMWKEIKSVISGVCEFGKSIVSGLTDLFGF
ncbi:hypothetical protein [Fusobacterium necrophorum]|uniref:Beta-class phenol-soluble modulin n=2 Tax=Fusobacterium necrophorum TaxID=859 RepID=A0AB73BVE2_9FUSO|nr:hypothetical protein [Fusobacterium necrophorum]KDE71039.1 hypothetical protein FUSO6_02605 [Fusobacterium necrophorum DAB]KDE62514.1 hypothetical protein FUSO3_07860 [Fusobacterium necrophorum BL]KDE64367.1 hypothetical protein FUSO4_08055 [Fusobacterium necrophorum DJ-1]KDE67159.1 hypothetical protein FUSO5_00905 [Fusobacterium necrophorum BFTR-1]KDE72849.1 hypothetical protein FUSO8_03800 [Fusobacterium necrophorum DJ-2]